MNKEPFRVEICGGIGSGKTTLAKRLARELGGSLVLEKFRANPFWTRYYRDKLTYVREKDICFLAQHAAEFRSATVSPVICDYAVVQNIAYAKIANNKDHLQVMISIFNLLCAGKHPPKILLHLRCSENTQLQRIQKRGRKEEQHITLAYLKDLNDAIEFVLPIYSTAEQIMVINTDENNLRTNNITVKNLTDRLRCVITTT